MKLRKRRIVAVVLAFVAVLGWVFANPASYETILTKMENDGAEVSLGETGEKLATAVLEELEVKGRAPKTGYSREEFYNGWPMVDGCSLRQRILKREFGESAVLEECTVVAGEFDEPYTGEHMVFSLKEEVSELEIDHVVALSDAWQKGAQYLTKEVRYEIATDPLNLIAVDGPANSQKSDSDAASWLPPNKKFRCQYVARQISVKYKYGLWVTEAEKAAMHEVLETCPNEKTVGI
ncbi:MAG: HNH endonuclease family protein [Candidatus Saccharibacteria bacterium]|nr:HNH endonuclease family protein [Candidatus Saccharibacteria bacterium]